MQLTAAAGICKKPSLGLLSLPPELECTCTWRHTSTPRDWPHELFAVPGKQAGAPGCVAASAVYSNPSQQGQLQRASGCLACMRRHVSQKAVHKAQRDAAAAGKGSFGWAWLLDERPEERARGVTIDVAASFFETPGRLVRLLDAPGHRDFVPNMIAGGGSLQITIVSSPGNNSVSHQVGKSSLHAAGMVLRLQLQSGLVMGSAHICNDLPCPRQHAHCRPTHTAACRSCSLAHMQACRM